VTAKSLLIFIADSCSIIENPDQQVQYLIELCYQNLAVIKKKSEANEEKN
jgi:hypothetical protein